MLVVIVLLESNLLLEQHACCPICIFEGVMLAYGLTQPFRPGM